MKRIFNKIMQVSNSIKLLMLAAVIAILSISSIATAKTELMEGHVKSLNVTTGETEYKETTDAKVDEVVQVQLWHHNRNNPAGEKVSNTKVRFEVPNQAGKVQIIKGISTSDNGNKVEGKTTVNLSMDRARLAYINGSAKFRYNKGAADGDTSCQTGFEFPAERCYTTVAIPDEVVTTGVNLDQYRGGPLTGCNAYHETVIIQVRSMADVVSVNKFVRRAGSTDVKDWKTSIDAKPGEKLEYMIRFKNEGNTKLEDVLVGDNLPKYHSYVKNSTMFANSNYPDGKKTESDKITQGGINLGNYNPGAVGMVWFTTQLDGISGYEKCGLYDLRNVGVVKPRGMVEHYNTAQVNINVECKEKQPEKPTYDCKILTLKELGGRKVRAEVAPKMSGKVSIKHYVYSFGDDSSPVITDKTSQEHTFVKDGSYTVRVKIVFTVDGKSVDVESDRCVAPITFTSGQPVIPEKPAVPSKPVELPATGPTEIVGIFVATTVAGMIAYNVVYRRFYM